MLTAKELQYYSRQLNLPGFGAEAQEKLKNSRVLVIGAGGLGCAALPYLAGAGVGTIGIVDGDKIQEHNLHRQTLYGFQEIGRLKADVAKEKLEAQNPYVNMISFPVFLDENNAEVLFSGYDLVVDCCDSIKTRYLINDTCIMLGKAFVYGAIHRFEGQVSVFNLNNGPTYRCLFPEEHENIQNCADAGVLGFLPGLIGVFQAAEAIKILSGIGNVLNGKILIYNSLTHQNQLLQVQRKNIDCEQLLPNRKPQKAAVIQQISTEMLSQLEDYIILDVRNRDEYPRIDAENLLEIPLAELAENVELIPKEKSLLCVCASGKRSAAAIHLLQEHGFTQKLFNLSTGLNPECLNLWKISQQL